MRKAIHDIILLCCLLCFSNNSYAQIGFYVPPGGKIFFNGDSATIFSNVINGGVFGVGKNAFVNFSGRIWENDPQSLITDESNAGLGVAGAGGWIRFMSDSFRQQIKGGYNAAIKSGPAFARLQIRNSRGVEINESSVKVRREFLFTTGRMYLKNYILIIGDGDPGLIRGYDSARYFVTGNAAGNGLLLRENISSANGKVVFPIGSGDQAYTPAAVINHSGVADDYYANVFDSVRFNLVSGKNMQLESVNKTWEIGKRNPAGTGQSEVFLQHLVGNEGNYFNQNRNNAYISWYSGSGWDVGSPQSYPSAGNLVLGRPLANSGVNSRMISNSVMGPSYFTKLTGFGDSIMQTTLWFNARRVGYSRVYVYWNTKPEVNVNRFIVERRLSNEMNFKKIDSVNSLVNGLISLSQLNYAVYDSNSYTGISYYRLKVLNQNGTFFYSNTIAVGGIPGRSLNLLWPNPTTDKFFISCDPVWQIENIVIYNEAGQKVKQENVHGRTIIEMGGLTPGNYFVSLIRVSGEIIETKKLVVIGK
jgi:hypothetical protein